MTTMAGKSAFPEDHPLSLGAGGHTITGTAATFLVKSDLVFGIGSSFAKGSFSSPIPVGKKIVQVVVDARDVDKDYLTSHAVVGDAKLVLRQIIDEVKSAKGGVKNDGSVASEVRDAKNVYLDEWLPRLTAAETPINPYRVIWDLMKTVDRANMIITHDSGNPRDQTLSFYEALAPRGYIGWGKSTQLGTGYGIAMGAKLAQPDKLVINVMGDLAFGTAGMEVETAVRERIPIMTVLLNNSCMGGYGHHMPTASQNYGSNRLSGNYSAVAEGLGAYSERVENPDDVVEAIRRGIQATQEGQPVVLEMITKEEPIYPAAPAMLKEIAERELARA
jgi:thiamine pyrophosphate-dependent acetolactate synthase large subunit-like protein